MIFDRNISSRGHFDIAPMSANIVSKIKQITEFFNSSRQHIVKHFISMSTTMLYVENMLTNMVDDNTLLQQSVK